MDCAAGGTPESKINAKQKFMQNQWTQEASAKATYKDASLQANEELVAEVNGGTSAPITCAVTCAVD